MLTLATAGAAAEPRSSGNPAVVVLDPGHGGSNAGAKGTIGIHEKELTLSIAKLVATRLRDRNITVELTRTSDATLTLRQQSLS